MESDRCGIAELGECAGPVGLYPAGRRCLDHSPGMLAGRRPPRPDPALTLAGLRAAAGRVPTLLPAATVVDERAIATGKRRAGRG